MTGRQQEIEKINRLLQSNRSEFLAVTGRRRVGKTYLIDSLLKTYFCFSMTGIQNGSMASQLVNFGVKLSEYDGSYTPQQINNWQEAFILLKKHLRTLDPARKHVIFIDELPWVDTPRSGFVQLLAHLWNDYLSKESHFILVICGSATTWIVKRVINDPGGLHNRITENIHLSPFTIAETQAFLAEKGIKLIPQEVAKIYMALGGIPFYLDHLRKGESFAAAIERMCFSPTGILHNEYNNLFHALFNRSEIHQSIVGALAGKYAGLSNKEIMRHIGLIKPDGGYHRALKELIISGFIEENTAWGKQKRGSLFFLSDEFCSFYHAFIKPNRKYSPGIWQQLSVSQTYKIWAGYAFEAFCFKHIPAIKKALGISALYTEIYSLQIPPTATEQGLQIDLIIDRKDGCVNLCEIKFHSSSYTLTQEEYNRQSNLKRRFLETTGAKKQVFITFITNLPLVENEYERQIVDARVTLEDILFHA